ncbi:MAG: hypothetical protein B6244_00050 [Candidatus Cloacimonetes bacterium 4572_55]|nr:MAG: hypothetical protein B6244_00050 [Candidatus Cloacimonetes bacterium 4572_55]
MLVDFSRESPDEVRSRLDKGWHGATISKEWEKYPDFRTPFNVSWENHRQAREWAYRHLLHRPTFAVDGSQIRPSPDQPLFPVGIVQIGWFENRHTPDGDYIKDNEIEVLPPNRLQQEKETSYSPSYSQAVDLIRTRMEMARIRRYIEEIPSDCSHKPMIFYDGPLLLSFAERLKETKQEYIAELMRLLNISAEKRVPIIGFTAHSRAFDVIRMLGTYYRERIDPSAVYDAQLLGPLLKIGERTPIMISRRMGIQQEYHKNWQNNIGFFYLKMSNRSLPSRIEFPLWMYEEGFSDAVNIIRGEIIVGSGYPYCLETADAASVITHQDQELFFRLLQSFAGKNGWDWSKSAKMTSKRRRR